MLNYLLMILLLLTSLFMIVLVLIQRGKGGGLAGAFGGMGGQSAFGTKAGDLFTKITIGVAVFWILLCIFAVKMYSVDKSAFSDKVGSDAQAEVGVSAPPSIDKKPADDKAEAPAPAKTPAK